MMKRTAAVFSGEGRRTTCDGSGVHPLVEGVFKGFV